MINLYFSSRDANNWKLAALNKIFLGFELLVRTNKTSSRAIWNCDGHFFPLYYVFVDQIIKKKGRKNNC